MPSTASPVTHATKDNPDGNNDSSSSITTSRHLLQRSDDADNESIPPHPDTRPHLSYLRSEWTSQDFRAPGNNEREHVLPQQIVLPSCTPSSAIENEIHRLQLGASGLCLTAMMITSLNGEEGNHVIQWVPPLLGIYWLVLTAIIYTRHDNILLPALAQHGALLSLAIIIPTITTRISCISCLIMTSISLCLFFVTRRIQYANSIQQRHYIHQHATAQKAVDEAVHNLANRRSSFLSIVSQEVQDAALMVITTLEQFSPSTILTNTHELLSACSIAVPIASISAINTTIKQVCYISSHLQLLARLLQEGKHESTTASSSEIETIRSNVSVEFDIGDLVQNVGDAMAGMAAKLDVNLILYHFDNGMHYTNVMGDEGAIRHGLLDLLRNILEGCTPGACIELGLNLESSDNNDKLNITFEITHTASPAIPDNLSSALLPNANLTVKLLEYLGGQLEVICVGKNRTRYNITVEMEPSHNGNHRKLLLLEEPTLSLYKQYPSVKFSNEPTLEELNRFIDSLKGLKMVLHARKRSIFARHLTSCLASWNVDISHVPVVSIATSTASDGTTPTSEDAGGDTPGTPETPSTCQSPQPSSQQQQQPQVPSPAIAEEQLHSIPPTFVLIDDDVETLERKLREFRNQPPASAHALQHHQQLRRHKSSRSISGGPAPNFFHQGTVAIIHFTSLTNYKRVRDAIRHFSSSPTMPPFSMPRLVVVPKPAGPRRFLTALHTAWNNSVVEPQFMPIATSPLSPTPHSIASVLQQPRSGTGTESPAIPGTPAAMGNFVETPHSDRSSHRSSPGEMNRRQRPGSGVYSPPAMMEGATSDTGNYFPMMGATTASSSTTGQSSPGQGSSNTTSLHHRAVAAAAAGRRRSYTDHALQPPSQQDLKQQQPLDTATLPSPPPPATTSSQLPLTPAESSHQPTVSTESQSHDTTSSHDHTDSNVSVDKSSPLQGPPSSSQQQPAPTAAAPSPPPPTVSTPGEKPTPKVMGPRRGLKLNKKRKADKGSAFANVVSPPINVLLVEDNMINIAILSTWMKKHKIGCTVANNGQEAVERWQQGGFHLVLMDLQLPVMSGIEATKKIRAVEKQQKIGVLPMNTSSSTTTDNGGGEKATGTSPSPTSSNSPEEEELAPSTFRSPVIIVALTASELESDRHAALAAGCNDFLTKPISLEWLEKKIIEWGCMQALIDFEGWRRWKRSTIDKPAQGKENKPSTLSKTTTTTPTTQAAPAPSKDEEDEEKAKNDDKRKGIMLAGAAGLGKRRFSTFDDKTRRFATGRNQGFIPGPMTKSGSDSDLLAGQSDKDRRQRSSNKQ
ncbi:hypothetical protein K492DRAFT_192773 [Lichtheimia hyalospora FSU 10163]|nr:hypothetical protein K492DRAFT_192773 [Lichtheimia hyalospora FSU 10163]